MPIIRLATPAQISNSLSRRPAQSPPAQQMQVQVKNRLAGAGPYVIDRAIAFLDPALSRDLGCDQLAVAQQLCIAILGLLESHNVLFRDDQQVSRRLRIDIFEGETPVIFVYF